MKYQYACNICDMMEILHSDRFAVGRDTRFLYVGSYFCDVYFCSTPIALWEECFSLADREHLSVVLVLPTPSQKLLDPVKQRAEKLVETYGSLVSEIAANDYGMLDWCAQRFPHMRLWCGRLLCKDTRDPRYSYTSPFKLMKKIHGGIYLGIRVYGAEADSIDAIPATDNGSCIMGIHLPYAYISMGRICEFASIGMPPEEKFRVRTHCGRQCVHHHLTYSQHGFRFCKAGKAVFAPNHLPEVPPDGPCIRFINSSLPLRIGESDNHP